MNREEAEKVLLRNGMFSDVEDRKAQEQFTSSCKEGNIEAARAFLALGMSTEIHDDISRETPLIRATEGEHNDIIDLLLEAGADLENRDSSNDTALMTAVNWSHEETARHLLKQGADPNASDGYKTPLTKSMEEMDDLVPAMIEACNDLNYQSDEDEAATQCAVQESQTDFLKSLLDAGADPDLCNKNGDSLLFKAVRSGNSEAVEVLIKAGADVNLANRFGWTPWMIAKQEDQCLEALEGAEEKDATPILSLLDAASGGDLDELKRCLESVSINATDADGTTAVMKAATAGDVEALQYLLEQGADPALNDNYGSNALCSAAQENQLEAARILLDAGVSPNLESGESKALEYAMDQDNPELVELIVDGGANISDLGHCNSTIVWGEYTNENRAKIFALIGERGGDLYVRDQFGEPLIVAFAGKGNVELVEALIDAGADINAADSSSCTALHKACESYNDENEKQTRLLLSRGADYRRVDTYDYSPLAKARSDDTHDAINVFEAFFQKKLDDVIAEMGIDSSQLDDTFFERFVETQDYETLLEWVRKGRKDMVDGLMRAGLDPESGFVHSDHPLEIAAKNHDPEMVEILLQHDADPNAEGSYGLTPLMSAVSEQDLQSVRMMLEAGGDPNQQDESHETAVTCAASNGNVPILELLHDEGGDANPERVGYTPLIRAALGGHIEAVRWLLNHDAHLDAVTSQRKSALTFAIENDNNELALLLIERGIDVNLVQEEGATALIDAVKKGNEEVIRALLDTGADPQKREKGGKSAAGHAAKRPELAELFGVEAEATEAPSYRPIDQGQPLTYFLRGAYEGDMDLVEEMLEEDVDPNETNYRGDSALMIAVLHGYEEIADRLIEAGADIAHTNTHKDTAYALALAKEATWKTKLEEAGVQIDMDGLNQMASIMMRTDEFTSALDSGDLDAVEKLIEEKAVDINALPRSGQRPLFRAIQREDVPMVKLLLERGAKPSLMYRDEDAFEAAEDCDNEELFELLEEAQEREED